MTVQTTDQGWGNTVNSTRGAAGGRRSAGFVAAAVLAALGAGVGPAAAQDEPAPPPIVGTNGANGYVVIEARTPGSGGGASAASPGAGAPQGSSTGGDAGSGSAGGGSSSGGRPAGGGPVTPVVNPFQSVGVADADYAGAQGYYNQCAPLADPAAAAGADPGLVDFCLTGGAPAAPGDPAAPAAPAAPPPPPDPAVVAQSAIAQLDLVASAPQLSANPRTAVGLPVWMWVDPGAASTGPLTATASIGGTTVTATATLDRIEWSMGPAGATVVCQGPGTPVAANTPLYVGDDSPTCGYSYELRSLPERTGGIGRWPVEATSVWTITWTGGGQTGGQDLSLTAGTDLEVGELQAVMTGGS